MGLYSAASQWQRFLLLLPSMLVRPFLPIMCQLYATGQFIRLRSMLTKTLYINVAIAGVMMVVAILSKFIMRLYGPGFEAGAPALLMVLCVALFLSAGTVVANLLVSARGMWLAFGFNALWGVVLLGAAALLAPRYGAFGLAASYAVAYAVHTAVQLSYFWIRCRDLRKPFEAPTGFNVIIPKPNVKAPIGEPK